MLLCWWRTRATANRVTAKLPGTCTCFSRPAVQSPGACCWQGPCCRRRRGFIYISDPVFPPQRDCKHEQWGHLELKRRRFPDRKQKTSVSTPSWRESVQGVMLEGFQTTPRPGLEPGLALLVGKGAGLIIPPWSLRCGACGSQRAGRVHTNRSQEVLGSQP